MGKFKKGDRIVYICKNPDSHDRQYKLYAGMTGTVIKGGFDTGSIIGISFDNYTFGNGKYHNSVHVNDTDVTFYNPKFKTGDKVELLCEPDDNASAKNTLKPGMTGIVCIAGNEHDIPAVEFNNFNEGWGSKRNSWFVNANILRKIKEPKFKFDIGDVVKTNTGFASSADGKIGKIINISKGILGGTIYLVEFYESSPCFHDGDVKDNILIKGNKTGKDKHCYYLRESALVKCDKEPKFKFNVGDRVIIYNCLLDHDNREGKILNACKSSTGKLYYLVEMDFADPKRFHNGYCSQLNVLVGYKKGKENQCYYAGEDELFLLSKADEIEFSIIA